MRHACMLFDQVAGTSVGRQLAPRRLVRKRTGVARHPDRERAEHEHDVGHRAHADAHLAHEGRRSGVAARGVRVAPRVVQRQAEALRALDHRVSATHYFFGHVRQQRLQLRHILRELDRLQPLDSVRDSLTRSGQGGPNALAQRGPLFAPRMLVREYHRVSVDADAVVVDADLRHFVEQQSRLDDRPGG